MELQNFYEETTTAINEGRDALANATTAAKYAIEARVCLEAIRKLVNLVDENAPQIEDFPEIPA